MEADAETRERIRNLAIVGTAVSEWESESTQQSNQFVAMGALEKFEAGIDRLNLDPESRKGMQDLINYLRKKIQKRMTASVNGDALT